ncbi:MAG: right-handed parallel beta-helix repeat-containing protein, partial [candidate division Zixibacteria bacterium]|nr:right-handed parallel beta-helix repeat-containing protein [candidate division Zixibacteria bacterium]
RNVENPGGAVTVPDGNSPTFLSCVLRDNHGYDGAAIFCSGNNVNIRGCSFIDNRASWEGGAIALISAQNVTVDSCVFIGNSAYASAGAIYMRFSTGATVTRNVAYGNSEDGMGGGFVYVYSDSDIAIRGNTIVGNSAASRGGGITYWSASNLDIRNNIVAFCRTGSGIFAGGSNSGVSLEYNDVFGNAGGDYYGTAPGTGSISVDPMIVDTTQLDLRVSCSSPCIGTGDPDPSYNDPDGTRSDMGALGCFDRPFAENPTLIFPLASDHIIYDMLPTFSWTDVAGDVTYRLELSINQNFTFLMTVDSLAAPQYQFTDSLEFSTHYWWRVVATDKNGDFTVSDTADFWTWTLGDVNHTHDVSIGDVMAIVDHLYISHAPIEPLKVGDVNADCKITIADIVRLVTHMFISRIELRVGCE